MYRIQFTINEFKSKKSTITEFKDKANEEIKSKTDLLIVNKIPNFKYIFNRIKCIQSIIIILMILIIIIFLILLN
jgi:Ni,Fe-hydrogenase I cytochrome b subunit